MPKESLFDYIRGYQDSHDCSDDDMLKILCDTVETFFPDSEKIINKLKEYLPIDEETGL